MGGKDVRLTLKSR